MTSTNNLNSSYLEIIKNKGFQYFRTARLSAWLTAAVFFLIGEWYSINSFPFNHTIFILVSLAGILSSTSWINFVFDKELDTFSGQDVTFFKHISPKEMLLFSIFISIISLILMLYISIIIFLGGLLIFFIGVIYSVPPLRLKIHPPFDSIANALNFGSFPLFLGLLLKEEKIFSFQLVILLIISGLIVVIYYLLIDILDLETDKKYGIKTSVTILGLKNTINVCFIMYFFTLILSIIYFNMFSLISFSLIICLPFLVAIKIKNDDKSIAKILSSISLIWVESILLFLFVLSLSIIPILLFILVLLSALYFIYVFLTIEKNKKKFEKI